MAARAMLVVLSGPSGVGKDTIAERLIAAHGARIAVAITATTRAPRPGERDGIDYHFVTPEWFQRMDADGQMLETAVVYGHTYGVPRESVRAILESGRIALVKTDIQGGETIRARLPATLLIFVSPPSPESLERRIRTRGGMDEADVSIRLVEARSEMLRRPLFDHEVVNEDDAADDAAQRVWRIIQQDYDRPGREETRL